MKPPQRGQVANWNQEGLGNLRASAWGSDDGWTVLNGGLDGEVPFPPDAAIVLIGKSPADAEFRPERGEKRGHGLLALGAGIRRGGVNPAGHGKGRRELG